MRSAIPFLLVVGSVASFGTARADDSVRIYRKVVPGVVWIRNHIDKSVFTGTGFLIDRRNKLVVTNHHVAQRKARVDVFFPAPDGKGSWVAKPSYYTDNLPALKKAGYYAEGALVAYDPAADLAIYKVSAVPDTAHEFGVANADPRTDDKLHVLGNPAARDLWRYCVAIEPVVTTLRTSASNAEDAYSYKALSMTSSTFGGNSGGPVLNDAGAVVGVLSRGGGEGGKSAVAVHRSELTALLATMKPHAVFSIENPTRVALNYQVKWDDGEWKSYTENAGGYSRTFWNTKSGTVPYLRYDCSNDPGVQEKLYKINTFGVYLGKNVSPKLKDHAKEYHFQFDKTGKTIEVYEKK